MSRDRKESPLPVLAAVGAMLACCLLPLLAVSGGSGIAAWLGGVDPGAAAAVAGAVAVVGAVAVIRARRRAAAGPETAGTRPAEGRE